MSYQNMDAYGEPMMYTRTYEQKKSSLNVKTVVLTTLIATLTITTMYAIYRFVFYAWHASCSKRQSTQDNVSLTFNGPTQDSTSGQKDTDSNKQSKSDACSALSELISGKNNHSRNPKEIYELVRKCYT